MSAASTIRHSGTPTDFLRRLSAGYFLDDICEATAQNRFVWRATNSRSIKFSSDQDTQHAVEQSNVGLQDRIGK